MNNYLKQILLKIARLSKADQRWIISKLAKKEAQLFNQAQGEQLLQYANHFRKLKKAATEPQKSSLFPVCEKGENIGSQLAYLPKLYIAIVLDQGNYAWHENFLCRFDTDGSISHLLNTHIKLLKQATRQALFKQWQATFSFSEAMENNHG